MRRNMNLIRKILKHVELNATMDDVLDVPHFPGFDDSVVLYHVELCIQAEFITSITPGSGQVLIQRLAWAGHEELARLRNAE